MKKKMKQKNVLRGFFLAESSKTSDTKPLGRHETGVESIHAHVACAKREKCF